MKGNDGHVINISELTADVLGGCDDSKIREMTVGVLEAAARLQTSSAEMAAVSAQLAMNAVLPLNATERLIMLLVLQHMIQGAITSADAGVCEQLGLAARVH